MIRYLFAAFFSRPRIPGFGPLPVNAMGVAALGLLGFANPGFWLLGLGLETAYLSVLANNGRFRKVVDARRTAGGAIPKAAQADLGGELGPGSRQELARVDAQMGRILALYAQLGVDDFLASSNRESLGILRGHYLKLLQAEEGIETHWSGDPESLRREIADLEEELRQEGMTEELRTSRLRTLEIYQQRLENQSRKDSMLAEIASELRRIEAQFELALENAAMSSQPTSISADLAFDLSQMDPRLLAGGASGAEGKARAARRARQKEAN